MADTVVPSKTDLEIAEEGIRTQLEARGLLPLMEDPSFRDFIENQIMVIASKEAYVQLLYGILHGDTTPPDS